MARTKAQEQYKLSLVAELMNHFVRDENKAYANEVKELKDDCQTLDARVYQAEGEMHQMQNLIERLQFENLRLRESNAFLYNRTVYQRNQIHMLEARILDQDETETELDELMSSEE